MVNLYSTINHIYYNFSILQNFELYYNRIMFKYIIKLTIISVFLVNGQSFSEEIYKWVDEEGVENYSNDPTQVPYGNWVSSTNKKSETKKSETDDKNTDNTIDHSANLPDTAKKQFDKYLFAEKKLQAIISAKNEELDNLKKQNDVSKDEILKLENFILQAEDRLKIVQKEKNELLKRNNLNSDT